MVSGVNGSGYDVTSIWQNLFNKIDENGDGSIDKAEMELIVSKNGPSVEDIFTKMDSDQNGVIGKNEYEEALSQLRSHRPPGPPPQANMGASPEDMFNKIDQNGDGSISKSELDAYMEKMKEERESGPLPEFTASNANGDQDWEIKMIEKLLSGYAVASNESTESISRYA